MRAIGDTHEKVEIYSKLIQGVDKSLQVGDLGLQRAHDWVLANVDTANHKTVFGNHDYYPYVEREHSMGHFSYDETTGIFTIRGAKTRDIKGTKWTLVFNEDGTKAIDPDTGKPAKKLEYFERIEGVDLFEHDEQLNHQQFADAIDLFEKVKPSVVVSHDCPLDAAIALFNPWDGGRSFTTQGLQACFEIHQPDLWIFGHWHRSKDEKIGGTRFVCLAELEVFDF